jgi:hypothetical protein
MMAIYAILERPDGSNYDVELEPDWRVYLADGSIIFAEDLMPGHVIQADYDAAYDEPGAPHRVMSVMGE